jgi:hypothetical protein
VEKFFSTAAAHDQILPQLRQLQRSTGCLKEVRKAYDRQLSPADDLLVSNVDTNDIRARWLPELIGQIPQAGISGPRRSKKKPAEASFLL